ncbi:hypothetical protein A1O1_08013 [Capronia coronata CBS 617.96]|uniref:NCS1 family nucleobase:cation symporter-1 n=1 Tax=Capronia coronata CBS 617.96 TaxID=1182541 RepID=W9XYC3_9EURO|nr:uncharacterized protein A1O1_08013 [Capronia coronata CBS 617.96]EXJ81946.1 hypothetical protein A1O1_08013 [Capronia coronata CBS 617.96]
MSSLEIDPRLSMEKFGSHPADSSMTDVEKGTVHTATTPIGNGTSKLAKLSARIEGLAGIETRGIERVPDEERQGKASLKDYMHMFQMWFGINLTANGINIGLLGPAVYALGFTDAMLLCTFGTLTGCLCTGYIATFGPQSGCRTMVVTRFSMGWWPSRLAVILNIVIGLGYGVVNCLTAGLILAAVNGHGMTPIVGVIISALITWIIATCGMKWFRTFEQYAWMPQILLFMLMIGCTGPHWDTDLKSPLSGQPLLASRISYFFLSMSPPLSWASYATDYYIYLPKNTSKTLLCLLTAGGCLCSKLIVLYIGIGLGSGLTSNPAWGTAFDTSTGELIITSLSPLGTFGNFCGVLLALGLVANQVPGAYSCSFNFQLLGSWPAKLPRYFWSTVSVIIYAVCAIAGRAYLLSIFNGFLALIGYWTIIWIALVAEDQAFRWKSGYDWEAWNNKSKLPLGIAALIAFCVGWVGAVLCMYETYFTGPIAAMIGGGADIGLPVSAAWAAIVYPPLRYLELKWIHR